MSTDVIITAIIGIVTTFTSGLFSYFFTKRKYNSEVDSNDIQNLKDSLDFYKTIVEENNRRLTFYIEMAESNRQEVYRLKSILHKVMNNSCLDDKCIKRIFYSEDQIREILLGVKEKKDEVSAREEIS